MAIFSTFSFVLPRFAVGRSFLSVLRIGSGAFGEPHVVWGTFARFVAYAEQLKWFLPKARFRALAILATYAERFWLFSRYLAGGRESPRTSLVTF